MARLSGRACMPVPTMLVLRYVLACRPAVLLCMRRFEAPYSAAFLLTYFKYMPRARGRRPKRPVCFASYPVTRVTDVPH